MVGAALIRAAASSIASGNPSRRTQISAMAGALALVTWNSGLTAWARWMKSATASYCDSATRSGKCLGSGTARGGTANSCSPRTCSTARLVTITLSIGQAARSSATYTAALDHLLEVVQQQQELLPVQGCFQQIEQGLICDFFDVECLGNGGHDEFGIADGSQVHEIHPIGEQVTEFCCYLQTQAGFAYATRSRQGQQPYLFTLQEVQYVATSFSRPMSGVGWMGRLLGLAVEGLEGWEIGRQARNDELIQMTWTL